MRWYAGRSLALTATALCALVASTAFSARVPSASPKWVKISANTKLGIASAGLLRTSDGRLHVVWPSHDGVTYSLRYSTLGAHAALVNTGTIVKGWSAVSATPHLVPAPNGGLRLVFTGGNGVSGSPFNLNAMYSATAGKAGQTWALTHGSLSHSTLVPLTDTAAVNEKNGTPVAGWGAVTAFDYHVGIDSQTPSSTPDTSVNLGAGNALVGPTLARDGSGGIWAAWFNESGKANQGYYVDQILPTTKAKMKAPGSGGSFGNNQPFQYVAFTSRVGGGEYLAYCTPSKTVLCAHVNLWKAGSSKALVVPGSGTGGAIHVAIAAGPKGHLWVMWFDTKLNQVRVVQTNAAATGFGTVRSIPGPPLQDQFDALQAEGSTGPLDIIALVLQNKAGSTPSYWATELAS